MGYDLCEGSRLVSIECGAMVMDCLRYYGDGILRVGDHMDCFLVCFDYSVGEVLLFDVWTT